MPRVDLRHLLQTHGLAARKAYGQCFLHDIGVLTRIAEHPIHRIDELLPWNIGRPLRAQQPEDHCKMAA